MRQLHPPITGAAEAKFISTLSNIDTNPSCKAGNSVGSFSKFQMQRLHLNPWFRLGYLNTEVYGLFKTDVLEEMKS